MRFFLRTLAITICAAMSFANAQAQVITADRAQEIANSFFSSGMKKSPAARSTAVSLNKSADSHILTNTGSSEAPTFHILTPASGEGFVIVSGEEIENPIIGYSFEGTIDTNNLPVGFVDYIADIDAQVKALRKYNAENPQKAAAARSAMQKTNYNATTMGNKVYLETASWGQGYPFNTQCFTSYNGSTNALTGCVPTAYAIIMRYHEWPLIGTGTLYNCQAPTYVEITDRTYDYSKMPLVYDGNWSTEQINEVAKLMSHLGHAFMVSYGSSQTSVSDPSNTDKPNKYFNYNLVSASYQANFTMDSWEEKIKESIDNGCPIPYASDNAGTGDTRHMFVLDGYTQNDYFHFNFGWNGNGNGWFKLDAITPLQGDNYSWQDGADHYAIFNFTPNKTKYAVNASVSPANAGTVSINGGATATTATGEYLEGATVTLAATANTGYTFSNWTKGGDVISTSKSCQVKVASSDNDYVANFLTVGNTKVNVSVTYNSSYGTVTSTSGTIATGSTLTPYLNEEVTLTATPADGYIFTGWTVTKGTEDDTCNTNTLTFVATGEMSVTANFALAVVDYNMIIDNVSPSGSSTGARNSTWTYNTDNNHPAALKLQSTNGSKEVYGLSNTSNRLYAYVYDANTTGYSSATYTLSVPDGYIITSYNLTYWVYNSYIGQVTVSNGTTTETPSDTKDHYLTANPNAQTAQFTISTSQSGQQYITIKSFIVTVMKDGAGSGSTPPPTQYTITATANPGTAGSVTGGGTYNEGATVTLTATPNSGYEFVNWTSGTTTVSTNATYSFTANASASYVANFQAANPTTFAVTTTANPAAGGTATFSVGTNPATTSASVASGTGVTLYAVANDGYRFVNWTKGGMEVSTNATHNVTITEASDFVANFEEEATATEYPTPTGVTYTDNYLTSITTTGGDTNIGYSANAHPGQSLVVVPGKVQLEKGKSFTMSLIAKSLGAGSSSIAREDMRYCHASLFTDFDQDFTFQAERVQGWGNQPPTNNVYGNYDYVMNITHTITVPDDAPTGESHVRMIYTNAWKDWPANGTATLDKGIVYDIVVEVVEKVDITANAGEGGSVTINGEATGTKRVIKGSSVTLNATPASGYSFLNWSNTEGIVSETAEYSFTANSATTLTANFERITYTVNVNANPIEGGTATFAVGTNPATTSASVAGGTQVTLYAVANTGYRFVNWTNGTSTISSEATANVTINANSNFVANFEQEVQDVLTTGYYHLVSKATARTEHLYNDAFLNGNSLKFTLQSNNMVNTNNGIWHIEVRDNNKLGIVNGDGNPIVAGASNGGSILGSYTELTVGSTKDVGEYRYYYFTEALNCSNGGNQFKVNGVDYLTTWTDGGAAADDNQWRFEPVDMDGMNVYDVVVECTDKDVYVTYGSEYAFNGGFFITNETITAQQLTAKKNNAAAQDVTISVEDYTIRVVDIEYVDITVSTTPPEGGTATINGEATGTKRVIKGSEVTLTATPAEGYVFANWTNNLNTDVVAENPYTVTATADVTYTANFKEKVVTPTTYTITARANPEEAGSVTGGGTYTEGETVTLTATPNSGYEFVNWTSGTTTVSTDATYSFTANASAEYIANFRTAAPTTFAVTTTANPAAGGTATFAVGTGQATTSATVASGTGVTLYAVANDGYRFVNWTKGGMEVSTEATHNVTITEASDFVANFEEEAAVGGGNDTDHKIVTNGTTGDVSEASKESDSYYKVWTSSNSPKIVLTSSDYTIAKNDNELRLRAATYTLSLDNSVDEDLKIVSYTINYEKNAKSSSITLSAEGEEDQTPGETIELQHFVVDSFDPTRSTSFTVATGQASQTIWVKSIDITLRGITDYTKLEDGVAYKIRARMEGGKYGYVYCDSTNLKYTMDEGFSDSYIFVVQKAEDDDKKVNLISALGYYGWNQDGTLSNEYANIEIANGIGMEGRTLYSATGTYCYTFSTDDEGNIEAKKDFAINKNVEGNITSDFDFVKVPGYKFNVSVADGSNAKLGTINLPFATKLPEGITAYKADVQDDDLVMSELDLTDKILPANTPVLIEGTISGTFTFGFAPAPASNKTYDTGFSGTLDAKDIDSNVEAYILSYDGAGTEIKFYKLSRTNRKINANKAYFVDSTGSSATAFRIRFAGVTGIDGIEEENEMHESVYDLQGRKLEKVTSPGIYIVDGKKKYIK